MKSKIFRIFALLLSLVMTVSMFAACSDTTPPTEGPTEPTTEPTQEPTEEPTQDQTNSLKLCDYAIFQGIGSPGSWYIIDALTQLGGETPKHFDSERKMPYEKEIIMCAKEPEDASPSSRGDVAEFYEMLGDGQWLIARKDDDGDERIYIIGNRSGLTAEASHYFIEHFIKNNEPIEDGYLYISEKTPRAYAPDVYCENGTYYLFSQHTGTRYITTTDLVHWSNNAEFVDDSALKVDNINAYRDVELHKINGKYYIVAVCDSRLVLLASDSIDGEFTRLTDANYLPDVPYTVNFPTLYVDTDGSVWVFYVADWLAKTDYRGNVFAAKLSADMTSAEAPIKLFGKDTIHDTGYDTEAISVIKTEKGSLLILFADYDGRRDRSLRINACRSTDGNVTGPWTLDNAVVYTCNIESGSNELTLEGLTNGTIITAPDGSLKMLCCTDSSNDWGRVRVRNLIYDQIDDAFYFDFDDCHTIEDFSIYIEE